MFTPGVIKLAFSDATAKSQLATNWQPAAAAIPQLLLLLVVINALLFALN